MSIEELLFIKKELKIIVHNPNNLPTIDFHMLTELQGDLKISTPKKIQKLKNSIIKYGVFVPKFVWKDKSELMTRFYIEDGHQTRKALTELEAEGYAIPAIPYADIAATDKKDAAEKLLMISSKFADINPDTSFFTDFDISIDYLNEIEIPELDLAFEDLDAKAIEEDEVPEVPEEPVTQVGDLWTCGKHRVLCGDATKAEDVKRLMDEKKADMVFTSLPYNANSHLTIFNKEENKWESKNLYGAKNEEIDNKTSKNYITFNNKIFDNLKIVLNKTANVFYNLNYNKNARFEYISVVRNAITKGFMLFETIIWEKRGMPISDTQSMSRNYEFIFLFNQSEKYYSNLKYAEYTSNLWKINNTNIQQEGLKACFPVELPATAIKDYCPSPGSILDPFLGSGTTLIAADQLNRICYGIEIMPEYVDVILERYAKLTGDDPVRQDGKKWSELKSI